MSEANSSVIGRYLRLGLALAGATLLLDQATKLWMLYTFHGRIFDVIRMPVNPIPVLSFLDLTSVWNYGISYGLFQQEGNAGRWVLTGIKITAAVFLTFWLRKVEARSEAVGIGLIIGGAVGNAIDRIWHGAVFDFVHLHWGSFSWYVFNVADAAIVIGVVFMLAGQLFAARSAVEKP